MQEVHPIRVKSPNSLVAVVADARGHIGDISESGVAEEVPRINLNNVLGNGVSKQDHGSRNTGGLRNGIGRNLGMPYSARTASSTASRRTYSMRAPPSTDRVPSTLSRTSERAGPKACTRRDERAQICGWKTASAKAPPPRANADKTMRFRHGAAAEGRPGDGYLHGRAQPQVSQPYKQWKQRYAQRQGNIHHYDGGSGFGDVEEDNATVQGGLKERKGGGRPVERVIRHQHRPSGARNQEDSGSPLVHARHRSFSRGRGSHMVQADGGLSPQKTKAPGGDHYIRSRLTVL